MARFRHIETVMVQADLSAAEAGPGFSDLMAHGAGAQARLYGVRADENGLEQRRAAGLELQDRGSLAEGAGLDVPHGLVLTEMDGASVLLIHGRYGRDIDAVRLDADGGFGDDFTLHMQDSAPGALTALVASPGAELIVTASRHASGLTVWDRSGTTLAKVGEAVWEEMLGANDVFALSIVQLGGQARLLALSSGGNSLLNFALGPEGQLDDMHRLGVQEGLFTQHPDHLEIVQLEGQSYALLGASGSSSLAVVALEAGGRMTLRDHVRDDLGTRFNDLSVLEALTLEGQVYVLAGGADDGLSLMTLLPGGRLLHLDTLPQGVEMALDNPAGLALTGGTAGIDIVVAGGTKSGQAGLSRLQVALGEIGITRQVGPGADRHEGTDGRDQIAGGAGNDTLLGGGGDDVLIDGAGRDVLRGGAGADVFVLVEDGRADRIADFEPGVDRLDLSAMGHFSTEDAIGITATATGARIDLGAERLWLDTADGTSLGADDFTLSDLRDLWHVSIAPPEDGLDLSSPTAPPMEPDRPVEPNPAVTPDLPPDPPQVLIGTRGADILQGGSGDDRLVGEAGNAAFDMVSGQVYRLYQATLGRTPDLGGFQDWHDRLTTGEATLTQAAGRFVASVEFRRTYGSLDDGDFITLLYQNVLGRNPDPVGFASWTGQLGNEVLSRAEVVEGFSQSREFTAATATDAMSYSWAGLQAQFSDEVFRLYRATLDRKPDLVGFRDWTEKLAGGMEYGEAIFGFTGSREFLRNYGDTDDKGFVTLLYNNVLDRDPDPAGRAHWLGKLETLGWSRADVVEAFAQSREFVAKTSPELTAWAHAAGPDDVLDGGGGDDILMGGILSDSFVFHVDADGHHVVVDYEPWDRLEFNGFGYDIPQEARAHMTQAGRDVVFRDQGVEIVLNNTVLEDVLLWD